MPASAFITAVQPNYDTNESAVPLIDTACPGATDTLPVWLMGFSFANTANAQATIRVTDGSGRSIAPDIIVPGKSLVPFGFNMRPVVGLRWFASAAGVNGRVWGYQ